MYSYAKKDSESKNEAIQKKTYNNKCSEQQLVKLPDNRPTSVSQRKLQELANAYTSQHKPIQKQVNSCIQRMPEDLARQVTVTFNTLFHVGRAPVTSAQDAIQLTIDRINTGWLGQQNHVVYDCNKANLENMLFDKLLHDEYIIQNGDYLVQLPDVNYYIVQRNRTYVLSGGQCSMLINRHNMKASHMQFH